MYPNCSDLSYDKIFARNVKARREAMGLTRKELAEGHMGYPEELLARVEEGDSTGCTIDFLVCLAEYLKESLETLMTSRYYCPHYGEAQAIGEFGKAYLEAERELRDECDEMVRNGELSEEEAEFRFQMVRDEILESMADAAMG